MAFNLADKIQKSLTSYDVRNIHGWTDSTVLLYHEYTMQNVYANPIQELWWTGQQNKWPSQPNIKAIEKSEKEGKPIKSVLVTNTTVEQGKNELYKLLLKYNILKIIKIASS